MQRRRTECRSSLPWHSFLPIEDNRPRRKKKKRKKEKSWPALLLCDGVISLYGRTSARCRLGSASQSQRSAPRPCMSLSKKPPLSPGPLAGILLGPHGIIGCDDVDYTRFWSSCCRGQSQKYARRIPGLASIGFATRRRETRISQAKPLYMAQCAAS